LLVEQAQLHDVAFDERPSLRLGDGRDVMEPGGREVFDLALQSISDGEYGICESCQEDIDPRRLEAEPTVTLCVQCQKEIENRDKRSAR
jgi:RNA polymerase-binding transcription factor DksA